MLVECAVARSPLPCGYVPIPLCLCPRSRVAWSPFLCAGSWRLWHPDGRSPPGLPCVRRVTLAKCSEPGVPSVLVCTPVIRALLGDLPEAEVRQ